MIRTARILLAGLLHVLAAKVDARETTIVEMTIQEMDPYYDAMQQRIADLDAQARIN
jgi:hypothetical protein